ncbi:MAG: hypothetical protein ABL994_11580 [Verrucomicrobiales bacterium]
MAKTHEDLERTALARKLDGLKDLSAGWDSYSAPVPVADTIVRARGLVDALLLHGYAITHVGPSALGGVGITVEQDETEYAIEFRNSGKAIVTEIGADDGFTVHELTDALAFQSDVLSMLDKGVA